jgi:nicotinamide mononucleotide adenylyltransferase
MHFWERHIAINDALIDAGLSRRRFSIVPFPINDPRRISAYVPASATFYMTIYDSWGEHKLQLLREQGFNTHVLWRRPSSEKGITATEVRNRIATDRNWQRLVPQAVARVLTECGVGRRIADRRPENTNTNVEERRDAYPEGDLPRGVGRRLSEVVD